MKNETPFSEQKPHLPRNSARESDAPPAPTSTAATKYAATLLCLFNTGLSQRPPPLLRPDRRLPQKSHQTQSSADEES